MLLTRLSAAMLAAGLLVPSEGHAQTMTIDNASSAKVYVHFFDANDQLRIVACGTVMMAPTTTQQVARDASPDCRRFDQLTLLVNFTEFWGGWVGGCRESPVPWNKLLTIRGSDQGVECY